MIIFLYLLKMIGKWYLLASISPYGVTPFEDCGIATKTYNANNNTLTIRSGHFNQQYVVQGVIVKIIE